jgi:peptidoglycan/xylan/chitin deacetylase (PgdA/CDA1 family)
MGITSIPVFIQKLFGSVTWRMPDTGPVLFLTFDDGPNPEVTPEILAVLSRYKAKATFFCVGENVQKHRDIFEKILDDGHAIGNHTFHHLNGWSTSTKKYSEDVLRCNQQLKEACNQSSLNNRQMSGNLFRPPYGKLKPSQFSKLKSAYSIIMWDVLSGDYNRNISGEKCFYNVVNNSRNGSIIVFHDSLKAKGHVLFALPKVLQYFSERNFSFRAIS